MYINELTNTYPFTDAMLRGSFKQVSFPTELTDDIRLEYGIHRVVLTESPEYNPLIEKLLEDYPVKQDGVWIQSWKVQPLSSEEVKKLNETFKEKIVTKTQDRLDAFARTRNYDGILSACTYATSNIPKFAAEGQSAVNLRDATWAALYQILEDVQAGKRNPPTGFQDIESDLPPLEWPV